MTDVRLRDPCCGNPVPLLVIGVVFAALALAACTSGKRAGTGT
ncbi:MAG: hypothetical protein WA633_04610 [Stellaceae bacterium]